MQTLSKLSKGVWLKNLAITLVIVAVLLISGHAYVQVVQNNLWESSVNNAYSLTVQGRNNLQRQVLKDYEEVNLIKHLYAQNASSIDKENINAIMGRKQERKRRFIIVDADTQFSADTDNSFRDLLRQYGNKTQGMLPVHISSQSGLSVFDIYVKGVDKQGRDFYVLKEYNVRELTNEFLLSFYDDKGFSYMVNKDGRIILRPTHPNSNKTMPNIFDTFDKETSEEVVKNLRASLAANENGWTEVMINGESTLVCYASMEKSLGWTIMTLIPNSVINAEADAIIRDTMLLLALVVLGMLFLTGAYTLSYNRYRQYMVEQSYRNHWFDTLSQNSENVFLIYDANLKKTEYTFDNIYRVLGIEREKVQQDIMSLCHIALDVSLSEVLQQVKSGTLESYNTTTFRYRNDYLNELRQANMTIYSLDDKGDPGKYVICLTDCTEEMTIRKMLEDSLDEAQRSNQAKRAFLSAISHDVRTPLNGIMGMLEIAYMNIDDRAKLLECMGKIKTASSHLAELINQVLDMSRIESGKMSLQNANMDITELLQESVIIVQPLANNKGHELNLEIDVEHKRVLGDSVQLKQIFINLITNAIKYTENGGKINVSLHELASQQDKKQLFELVVEDNGLGMSEEFQKHIFEPFSRVQDSTTSGIQGTGLGMAIMKRIVDLMQGQIELESSLGEGSRFTITLPLELVVEAEQESKQQAKADLSIFKGKHVLLVDDVELNREIGEFILSSAGFEVTCLEDGKNAVVYMQNAKPGDVDLILMDLMMPIMDGYTAARLIRNLPDKQVAATPIIALTANAFEDTKQEVMAAGMNGHLAKPINKDELYKNLAGFFEQMSTPPICEEV